MKRMLFTGMVAGALLTGGGTLMSADSCGCGCDDAKDKGKTCPVVAEIDETLIVEYDGKIYFACDKKCFEKLKANPAECIKKCKSLTPVTSKSGKKGFIVYGHEKVDGGNTPKDDSGNTPKQDTGNTPKDDSGNSPKQDTGNTPKIDSGNSPKIDSGNSPKQPES